MTNVAFEMLRFLMLNQNFFIVEFTIAIPRDCLVKEIHSVLFT